MNRETAAYISIFFFAVPEAIQSSFVGYHVVNMSCQGLASELCQKPGQVYDYKMGFYYNI